MNLANGVGGVIMRRVGGVNLISKVCGVRINRNMSGGAGPSEVALFIPRYFWLDLPAEQSARI